MKSTIRKILSTVLAIAMIGAMSTNVMASEVESGDYAHNIVSEEDIPEIVDKVSSLISQMCKDARAFNVEEINFSEVSLGSKIIPVSYKNGIFIKENIVFFPLLEDDKIFAIATVGKSSKGSIIAEVGTNFAGILETLNACSDGVALVYDDNGMMATSPQKTIQIHKNRNKNVWHDEISYQSKPDYVKVKPIANISIGEKKTNEYNAGRTLSLPVRGQGSDSRMCWASCISSVGEYKTNIYRTVYDIINITGTPSGAGALIEDTANSLRSIYGVSCNLAYSPLYFTEVQNDIDRNLPVIVKMNMHGAYHAVAVSGYGGTSYNGTITFMNPDADGHGTGGMRAATISNNEAFHFSTYVVIDGYGTYVYYDSDSFIY